MLCFFVAGIALACAQVVPAWVSKVPVPGNNTYLYSVESGTATTELEARNQAIVRVFQTMALRLGMPVNSQAISKAVQQGEAIEVISTSYNLPINKVCEYTERVMGGGFRVYVLCQVARVGNIMPQWDVFTDCHDEAFKRDLAVWNYGEYPAREVVPRAFVPGMAQFYKGSTGKGAAFIIGEVAFVGGIVGAECVRQAAINRINATHDATLRTTYTRRANNAALVRNVSIAGAVAVYAWNVIDGIVARGKRHVFVGDNWQMDFAPYADGQSGGLAVHIAF